MPRRAAATIRDTFAAAFAPMVFLRRLLVITPFRDDFILRLRHTPPMLLPR